MFDIVAARCSRRSAAARGVCVVRWSSRRGSSRQFSLSRQQLHFNSPPFIVSPAFSPGYHIDIDGQTRQLCGGKRQTAAGDSWKLSPSRHPIDAICDLTNNKIFHLSHSSLWRNNHIRRLPIAIANPSYYFNNEALPHRHPHFLLSRLCASTTSWASIRRSSKLQRERH